MVQCSVKGREIVGSNPDTTDETELFLIVLHSFSRVQKYIFSESQLFCFKKQLIIRVLDQILLLNVQRT